VSGSGIIWAICKSASISLQTDNHLYMPFLPPNQQRQSTEDTSSTTSYTHAHCNTRTSQSFSTWGRLRDCPQRAIIHPSSVTILFAMPTYQQAGIKKAQTHMQYTNGSHFVAKTTKICWPVHKIETYIHTSMNWLSYLNKVSSCILNGVCT